jgi:hypothetical protein
MFLTHAITSAGIVFFWQAKRGRWRMARLRVWATKKEAALIAKADRKQRVTVNQFLHQILEKCLAPKKDSARIQRAKTIARERRNS